MFGRIRGRAEFGAVEAEDEKEDDEEYGETSDGVAEDLVGPEGGVRAAARFFGSDAVSSEEINMDADKGDDGAGNEPGVQGKKPGEGVMAVVVAADDDLLKGGPDERGDSGDVGRDFGGPEPLLIPR